MQRVKNEKQKKSMDNEDGISTIERYTPRFIYSNPSWLLLNGFLYTVITGEEKKNKHDYDDWL